VVETYPRKQFQYGNNRHRPVRYCYYAYQSIRQSECPAKSVFTRILEGLRWLGKQQSRGFPM
jgi:hypothetical protein